MKRYGSTAWPWRLDKSKQAILALHQYGINTTGGVFYHGATAGFEYSF